MSQSRLFLRAVSGLLAFLVLPCVAWAADCQATTAAQFAACVGSTTAGDTITIPPGNAVSLAGSGPFTIDGVVIVVGNSGTTPPEAVQLGATLSGPATGLT